MTEMTGKEARQRLTVLVQEIESKKTEFDNLLVLANQVKGQLDTINTDSNTKLGSINAIETQISQKLGSIDQILIDAKSKQEEIVKDKESLESSKGHIDELEKAVGELKEKAASIQSHSEALNKQIEEELHAGATSVNLSKSFADKVGEYKINSRFWSRCFVGLLLVLLTYYGVVTFSADKIPSIQEVWRNLVFRSPFLIFGIWLAIFFGNRRAESKKLEELYKHKEVMARSFVGYKQTLESIGDEDKTLLKKHMENLLEAMNENSAQFLSTEGDKHPIFELISSYFTRKDKTGNAGQEE